MHTNGAVVDAKLCIWVVSYIDKYSTRYRPDERNGGFDGERMTRATTLGAIYTKITQN
jgi:hypothetical protein